MTQIFTTALENRRSVVGSHLPADGDPVWMIHTEPVQSRNPNGGVTISVGFPVLVVTGWVKNPDEFAFHVAQALTEAGSAEWRCFHCDEVFTDRQAAKDHFGLDCLEVPGCIAILKEGEKAILEDRREWRERAFKAESENERLGCENNSLRFDLRAFKGAATVDGAYHQFLEMRNRLEAAEAALSAAPRWLAQLLRWRGEVRQNRRAGRPTPSLRLYLP